MDHSHRANKSNRVGRVWSPFLSPEIKHEFLPSTRDLSYFSGAVRGTWRTGGSLSRPCAPAAAQPQVPQGAGGQRPALPSSARGSGETGAGGGSRRLLPAARRAQALPAAELPPHANPAPDTTRARPPRPQRSRGRVTPSARLGGARRARCRYRCRCWLCPGGCSR